MSDPKPDPRPLEKPEVKSDGGGCLFPIAVFLMIWLIFMLSLYLNNEKI
jgi:hypothetical protein